MTQLFIPGASLVEKRFSTIRFLFQSLLKELVNFLPAFRSHENTARIVVGRDGQMIVQLSVVEASKRLRGWEQHFELLSSLRWGGTKVMWDFSSRTNDCGENRLRLYVRGHDSRASFELGLAASIRGDHFKFGL